MYDDRLHQVRDWEALLQGENDGKRHSLASAVLSPTASGAEPTEEGGSRDDERDSTALEND